MKKILLYVFVILLSINIQAQPWISSLENEAEKKEELTFFDIQNVVNDYYSVNNFDKGYYYIDGSKIKAPGWKQFKRWEWYWDSRVNIKTGEFPKTNTAAKWRDYVKKYPKAKSVSGNWQQLGPSQSDGGYSGIGRINCISFHPTDTNTYWVGAPSGGLWETTDDGQTWAVLTDENDVLGVSDIAIPSDFETSNTIYIATGDRDGGSVWTLGGGQYYDNHTVGVLKSTDGGATWNETGLNYTVDESWVIGRLLIDTTDNLTLLASTYSGIYKTTNGGTNWTKVHTSGYITDMEFKPGDSQVIYASSSSKVYKSIDGGDNWTEKLSISSSRIELAVTLDNPEFVYFIAANSSGGLVGIYKSTDSGENFTQTFSGTGTDHSLLYYYSDGSGDNSGQGNYDLAIAASPNDSNVVFIGGVNTWKSEDGGNTWNINNMWTSHTSYNFDGAPEVHADQHVLKFRDTLALFEGNDGGIYKTNNEGGNWNDLTNGMVISQIYRLGVSQTEANVVIIGLQDNGSKLIDVDDVWYDVKGGDGMECIIDPTDYNYQFGTYVNGEIERTTDAWNTGGNRTIISDNIADADGGWWVSPYILDPNNSQTIYVGYNDVWKSTDRGDNFTKISTMNSSNNLRSMAISTANSDVLYVADQYNVWKTDNGGSSWTDITGTLPSSNAITYIYVDQNDANNVWLTFGGFDSNRVYESTNGGTSWTSISAGLPSLPVFSIIQNKLSSAKHLYVGTDIGVFVKEGNNDWQLFSTGLPNVMVTELDIYYDEVTPDQSKIRAATFGRGLWESDLFDFQLAAIQLNSIMDTFYVSADSSAIINIPFEVNETFTSNTFKAFLSDNSGSFASEVEIGSLVSDVAGTIVGTIPKGTISGTEYQVKVKSTNPVFESPASNTFEIVLDNDPPTATINSEDGVITSSNPIPITITFSEAVSGFEIGDISITNGASSVLNTSDNLVYSIDVAPIAEGDVLIDIAAGVAEDFVGNKNSIVSQFAIMFDETSPDISLSSTETDPTVTTPFIVNIEFTEKVVGFEVSDIDVTNGVASNLVVVESDSIWNVSITPSPGIVLVDIDAGVVEDEAGNENNAATQWSITYSGTGFDKLLEYGVNIFPNPSKGIFRIESENKNITDISVIDLSGKIIYNDSFDSTKSKEVDLSEFAKGLYILNIYIENKTIISKILIE